MNFGLVSGNPWRAMTIAGISCLLLVPSSAQQPPAARPEPVGHIVVLQDSVAADAVTEVARAILESATAAIPSLRLAEREARAEPVLFRHALKGFAVRVSPGDEARLDWLAGRPEVAYVAEDSPVQLHAQLFQPGMERIRVRRNALTAINDLYDVNVDADIAIVDSGIDATHPDLNVYSGISFVSDEPTADDLHGHGTHVAGIAAAIDDAGGVYGVAPGARLWAVKVAGQNGEAQLSDVVAGLDYVAAHAGEIDVVNMSLGNQALGDDGNCGATIGDPLHQAICAVVDLGVVVVVSAGNFAPFGQDASFVRPAAYDEVITVSAVIETDGAGPAAGQGPAAGYGPDNAFASTFSNYGWDVDLAAPGVDVVSTWPGNAYSTQSGTSMAAPHVAGAAAVWIARNGKPSNRQEVLALRDDLVRLAFPQFGPDLGFVGDRENYAEPLLNVGAIDPVIFDPVEALLSTDKAIYDYGQDGEAIVTVELWDASGQPLGGIPGNGFSAYLAGQQLEIHFEEQGQGRYSLTTGIEGMLPGDYDFTAVIENLSGFQRSAGCRIVIRNPEPLLLIHDYAFLWPVMNHDSYFDSNYLFAGLMDENGAPVVMGTEEFQSTFSAGGELAWSLPDPNPVSGVSAGATYGVYESQVEGIHALPLGSYHADLTVSHDGMSGSGTASFEMAYHDPALMAELSTNLSSFDFTQPIAPPALEVTVEVTSEWQTGVPGLLFLVGEPFQVKVDGELVSGVIFTEDHPNMGSYLADGIDLDALSHGAHEIVVQVTDSRGLQVDSNPVTIDVVHESGTCADPFAAGGQADADGDGIRDECDNCPTVSNRSQSDVASDDPGGPGDACRELARISVSSDAADNPDFFTIQEAVDQANAASAKVRVEILPGNGPYLESVVVDRDQSFRFVGRDLGSGAAVVECGDPGGSAFWFRSTGASGVVVRNLVLRGQGVAADQHGVLLEPGISGRLSDLHFEQLGWGLRLGAGVHVAERISMDATVGTGLLLDDGTLSLRSGEFRGVARAIRIEGSSAQAELEHLLIVGNGADSGIARDSAASNTLDLRHATVANCATAVSGNSGNTTIAHSILWDNASDVVGVACADIAWSDLQQLDCGGTNRSLDPLFIDPAAGDYHLQATSPLLDHGPDPALYSGLPCLELDGGPRLRDHDGDGLAQVDPGVYERQNTPILPVEVSGLMWTSQATMQWDAAADAVEYHVYRAPLHELAYSAFGTCENGLDAVRTDTALTDAGLPPAGEGFYYEITVEDTAGRESTLGVGACAERSNFVPCP